MNWLRAGSALMVAALVCSFTFAQTTEDLQRQLDEFKAAMQSKVAKLEAENAALKSQQSAPAQDAGLETEINRLSERMAAGTNLRSCASQIKLGGEFRYRGYYSGGDNESFVVGTPGTEGPGPTTEEHDGWWGDARIRLNFQYDFGCDTTAYAELQSHFAFGQDPTGPINDFDGTDSGDLADVGMYQAWLEFRNLFGRSGLSCRIGRQEVVLGNQFQFGNADWFNGVVHDGLRVDWHSNCWGLTALAVKLDTTDGDFNQISSLFNDHDNDELYSLYFTLRSIRNVAIDAYWIYINGHGNLAHNSGASLPFDGGFLYPFADSAYYHTFGARAGGTLNVFCGLDFNVEGAIQTGNNENVDVDGATVEAEVGLTFDRKSRFRVFARGLWAEGPDTDSTGYLINFPNRHSNTGFRARYGLADLIPMTNVLTAQLGFHFDPACNWTLGATGLWAETDEEIASGIDDSYGTELDVWAEYRYSQQIALGMGLAFVWPDDSGQLVWGTDDGTQFVGYVQARLIF